MPDYGILSLVPALVAVALAFLTRETLFSILCGVLVGILISGQNLLFGFSKIVQEALGTEEFMWVVAIEVFIGIMVAFFQKSGAIDSVSRFLIEKLRVTARAAKVASVLLGIFIFFSDYFSPLFVGSVMRPITDKARISREKLAFLCHCTSSPKCILIPWAAWGVYVAGLLAAVSAFGNLDTGLRAVVASMPFQFYGILTLVFVLLNACGILPDFGPMKKAERRAQETGKVVADGDTPMLSEELGDIRPIAPRASSVWLHFAMPAVIVVVVAVWTWVQTGSAKVLESFIVAVFYQAVVLLIQRAFSIQEMMQVVVKGIKSVMGAILILALAYCINSISKTLGTSEYVISITQGWITPTTLLVLTFLVSAFMSFFTGTSWGVYAIMIPIVMPIALKVSGGSVAAPIVGATVAAVMGGGCFGDHCSPLSDTTVISALGAGSDLLAHVKTQLPYALVIAVVTCALYSVVSFVI